MRDAGVPSLPGSDGVVQNLGEARAAAKKIGFPIIIKAVAGGGGRGMRVARNDAELTRGSSRWPNLRRRRHSPTAMFMSSATSITRVTLRYRCSPTTTDHVVLNR